MQERQGALPTQTHKAAVAAQAVRPRGEALDFYRRPGGPLLAWLREEAMRRGDNLSKQAAALGVTPAYIVLLQTGKRRPEHIGQDFAEACARYLGVPTVVVKLLAGRLKASDFITPDGAAEVWRRRLLDEMVSDPAFGPLLGGIDLASLPTNLQDTLGALYAEATGVDVQHRRRLPEVVHHLQRAAVVHDEALGAAQKQPASTQQ